MKTYHSIFIIGIIWFLLSCDSAREKETDVVINPEIDWKYQVDSLLMPYWMMAEALGVPVGNFPTYRCDNGTISNCEELELLNLASWFITQTDSLRRDYLRIKSRQTYAYSVAYHLTGNEQYLEYAKNGVDFLLENGEYESGSPVSFWRNGEAGPHKPQRNTQDLAYSLTGFAMYYYLTRDEKVLNTMVRVKDYIFTEYYDKSTLSEKTKLFMWVKEDFENDKASSKQLVAQLDQLNAYLLLITPIVPDSLQESFIRDIRKICHLIKNNFYDEGLNLFWGDLNNKKIGIWNHTDFGHTIKSFWMFYLSGKLIGDQYLTKFAEENALKLLQTAYIPVNGGWASGYMNNSKELENYNISWIYNELDQMSATLSLKDTSLYSRYLVNTYDYWYDNFIDHNHKEVWLALDSTGVKIDSIPKINHWKNGYHSLEHALIGYLSTSNYYATETTLYYAFNKGLIPKAGKIRPYYYEAEIKNLTVSTFVNPLFKDLQKTKVIFENVK